jgi:hypothetical protein
MGKLFRMIYAVRKLLWKSGLPIVALCIARENSRWVSRFGIIAKNSSKSISFFYALI